MKDDKTTLREAYRFGTACLEGVPDGALDARILLLEAANLSLNTFLTEKDRVLSEKEAQTYRAYLERRKSREPVAYILEKQEFMGHSFHVTKDVLIPNQDTEILVETILRELNGNERILDLCTGSGCILLSLLKGKEGVTGVGTDLSDRALSVAKENASRFAVEDRAVFLQGDLFEALSGLPETELRSFDILVSNPPYIRTSVIPTLEEEVRVREPLMALDGGEDGLSFIRGIIAEGRTYLRDGGRLFMEIGFDQKEETERLLSEQGYQEIHTIRDYNHLDRVVTAKK